MEVLFTQRLETYTITPFKNYSSIRPPRPEPKVEDDPFDPKFYVRISPIMGVNREIPFIPPPTKGSETRYFYSTTYDLSAKPIRLSGSGKPYLTTNEKHLKRHFGNPFSRVTIRLSERSIIKRGDKIVIKLYTRVKTREINCKYYRISTTIDSISIDTKTGNFTISEIRNSPKRKKKKFRVNYFPMFLDHINKSIGLFTTNQNIFGKNKGLPEILKTFDDYEFIKKTFQHLGLENGKEFFMLENFLEYFGERFIEQFIEKRKIKIPNDFMGLFLYYYPTERYLKKNDRKLNAAILDRLGIKSKSTIKLLHEHPNINIKNLVHLCNIFGSNYQKYISNMSPFSIEKVKYGTKTIDHLLAGTVYEVLHDDTVTNIDYDITKKEKDNILSIINSNPIEPDPDKSSIRYLGHTSTTTFLGHLTDHFRMLRTIQKEYPNYRLYARTMTSFNEEHSTYSKIFNLLKREYFKKYIYNQYTIRNIEAPIIMSDGEVFHPQILTQDDEYIEEGNFMHHCVGSYINSEQSMIVSLRTNNDSIRVTNEFSLNSGQCVQSKHIHNKRPPENFDKPLILLKERVKELHLKNKLKWERTDRIKVTDVLGKKLTEPIHEMNEPELELMDLPI